MNKHGDEILLAAAFGLFFALVLDLLDPESRVRAGFRHLKNKLSERDRCYACGSESRHWKHRGKDAAYLASDKALYLATFQIVIGILVFIALGAATSEFQPIFPGLPYRLLSIGLYAIAVS